MRALLDTNIVIHRENKIVSSYSIGHLFRWLDRLRYDKVLHPFTIAEIKKYRDPAIQEAISVKIESYDVIKTIYEPNAVFLGKLGQPEKDENDHVDNTLLFEVYIGRVDVLITEDRRLRDKATHLGIADRVFSINGFISKATTENPELIEYKELSVKKVLFGEVNVKDNFFDSFRMAYDGFDSWFLRKCDEEAYICKSDEGKILGFLYLKTEDLSENYYDIEPVFEPKKRLKVGTFKVESTGFRLGERFIKIIFDNAQIRKVDEVYVTLFTDSGELVALENLLERWGFVFHGYKHGNNKVEKVLVKKLHSMDPKATPKFNYPNISYTCNKFILPIRPEYHTSLLPDSRLNSENNIDFLENEPYRYALQKVYISWGTTKGAKSGDLLLFYRMGVVGENKKYKSVISTIGIVDDIIEDVRTEKELLDLCQNRSVFTRSELTTFWSKHHHNLKIIKFIFLKSLTKRLTLGYLWEHNIIPAPKGPRPFTLINDEQFDMIIRDSDTELDYVEQ